MNIEVVYTGEEPDYRPLAESRMNALLEIVEDGKFRDPALEEEYQQWRRRRSKNTTR